MRKILLILILNFIFLNEILSCVCGKKRGIDEYQYIALVEIVKIKKSALYEATKNMNEFDPIFYEIEIKTINQFKGEKQNQIIILGGNRKYKMGETSCDLMIDLNEKWLIFGDKFKSMISTDYCTMSTRFQNKYGEKDYFYESAIKKIKRLNEYFSLNDTIQYEGEKIKKYKNGNIEIIETYLNGKLEGERTAYYSNGQIMLKENYIKGFKNGESIWWNKNGSFRRVCQFKDDKFICECYYYWDNNVISTIHFYSEEGEFLNTEQFDIYGKPK